MPAMTDPEHLQDRAVIRLGGADRKSFLQGLITQDMDALAPTTPIFAALLTPQGKILFDFFVYDNGDELLLDCNAEAAPALVKRLTLYKLRAAVTLEQDDALSVFAATQPFAINGADARPDPRHEALGWRLVTEANDAHTQTGAYETRRLALGAPEFGKDFDSSEMFLMDVNYDALGAVSYQKGCFVGQEVASRMKRKGEARKRTLIVDINGSAPERGSPVTAGESTLGEVLSASAPDADQSADKGRALAMIRLDRWEKAKAAGAVSVVNGSEALLSVPDYLEQD